MHLKRARTNVRRSARIRPSRPSVGTSAHHWSIHLSVHRVNHPVREGGDHFACGVARAQIVEPPAGGAAGEHVGTSARRIPSALHYRVEHERLEEGWTDDSIDIR